MRENGSKRVYTENKLPSKTDQSWRDDTDVNQILAKFHKTGQITHLAKIKGSYGDVSDVPDLDLAMQQIKDAEDAFMDLSAVVRKRFANSPSNMIEFLQDPKNNKEAIELGLKTGPELPIVNTPTPSKEKSDVKAQGDSKPSS